MTECVRCQKKTDEQYSLIKARYKEFSSYVREEKVPLLGRNYHSDESPEVRKVGEIRYYMEQDSILTGGLCPDCLKEKRKEDYWFRWSHFLTLAVALAAMTLGGKAAIIQFLSFFLLFMSLVGLVMRLTRFFSHNDAIRVAEVMEEYFLDEEKGGDGRTITVREFLFRPEKNTDRFILFNEEQWARLKTDEKGTYLT